MFNEVAIGLSFASNSFTMCRLLHLMVLLVQFTILLSVSLTLTAEFVYHLFCCDVQFVAVH